MKQITKQLKKLAPQWYAELKIPLKYNQRAENPNLDIANPGCCIVGEIYGFSNCYMLENNNNCWDCHVLSVKLSGESPLRRNNPLIPELINHINKAHPELMEGKKC